MDDFLFTPLDTPEGPPIASATIVEAPPSTHEHDGYALREHAHAEYVSREEHQALCARVDALTAIPEPGEEPEPAIEPEVEVVEPPEPKREPKVQKKRRAF